MVFSNADFKVAGARKFLILCSLKNEGKEVRSSKVVLEEK
jgi:hypothetical protein